MRLCLLKILVRDGFLPSPDCSPKQAQASPEVLGTLVSQHAEVALKPVIMVARIWVSVSVPCRFPESAGWCASLSLLVGLMDELREVKLGPKVNSLPRQLVEWPPIISLLGSKLIWAACPRDLSADTR
jgi:hypothetical protein